MKQASRLALLLLCFILFALPALAQRAEEIAYGDTVEGRLDDEHVTREYTFKADAGDTVSITLLSDDFDPLVVLRDANGQELAYNDDGGPGSLNSRIGPYTLAEAGEYTIVANSYANYFHNAGNSSVEGNFTLILEEINIRRIEYTQHVEDELTRSQLTAYYQFRGQAGDVINVVAESSAFTASVSLSQLGVDSTGSALASAIDAGGQGVALIGGFVLPATENYLVAVTSSAGDVGGFSLEVERLRVTPLAFGETVDVTLDAGNRVAYFSFDAEKDDVISLTVRGDGVLDTTLVLNAPEGYQLAYNDDSRNLDPEIANQILPASGIYTVLLQPYRPGAQGSVTLTLERGVLLSLDDGPQVLAMSSGQNRETLTLTGVAGDAVRLTLDVASGGPASPNIAVTQEQMSVAYGSGSTVRRLSLDFTIPADGILYIQIDEYSYTDVELRVSAERIGAESEPAAPDASAATATPTPATVPEPTPEAPPTADTDDMDDGLIEITDEPILEPTTDAPADETETAEPPAPETPETPETDEAPEPEATEAA